MINWRKGVLNLFYFLADNATLRNLRYIKSAKKVSRVLFSGAASEATAQIKTLDYLRDHVQNGGGCPGEFCE